MPKHPTLPNVPPAAENKQYSAHAHAHDHTHAYADTPTHLEIAMDVTVCVEDLQGTCNLECYVHTHGRRQCQVHKIWDLVNVGLCAAPVQEADTVGPGLVEPETQVRLYGAAPHLQGARMVQT